MPTEIHLDKPKNSQDVIDYVMTVLNSFPDIRVSQESIDPRTTGSSLIEECNNRIIHIKPRERICKILPATEIMAAPDNPSMGGQPPGVGMMGNHNQMREGYGTLDPSSSEQEHENEKESFVYVYTYESIHSLIGWILCRLGKSINPGYYEGFSRKTEDLMPSGLNQPQKKLYIASQEERTHEERQASRQVEEKFRRLFEEAETPQQQMTSQEQSDGFLEEFRKQIESDDQAEEADTSNSLQDLIDSLREGEDDE